MAFQIKESLHHSRRDQRGGQSLLKQLSTIYRIIL